VPVLSYEEDVMNIAGRAKLSMVRGRRREERGEAIQESRL